MSSTSWRCFLALKFKFGPLKIPFTLKRVDTKQKDIILALEISTPSVHSAKQKFYLVYWFNYKSDLILFHPIVWFFNTQLSLWYNLSSLLYIMEEETFTYLTSNTMATISTTLSLAATVTSFDCIELWTVDSDGSYYCPYVYATPQLQARCPHLLTGHHPRDKIDHVLSPKVRSCLIILEILRLY